MAFLTNNSLSSLPVYLFKYLGCQSWTSFKSSSFSFNSLSKIFFKVSSLNLSAFLLRLEASLVSILVVILSIDFLAPATLLSAKLILFNFSFSYFFWSIAILSATVTSETSKFVILILRLVPRFHRI